MAINNESLTAFIQAWNTPLAETRDAKLAIACAVDVTFTDGTTAITGLNALSDHIAVVRTEDPDARFAFKSWITGPGGRTAFRWLVRDGGRDDTHGRADVTGDANGRFTTIAVTVEPPPEPSSTFAKLRGWALGNPLAFVGVFALMVYLAVWWLADAFYSEFGAEPEDAGFGTVDLVLRQSSGLLGQFVTVGGKWAVAYTGVTVPIFYYVRMRQRTEVSLGFARVAAVIGFTAITLLTLPLGINEPNLPLVLFGLAASAAGIAVTVVSFNDTPARRQEGRFIAKWAAGALVFGGLFYGFFYMVPTGLDLAREDAARVKRGEPADHDGYPWRARPVTVWWKSSAPASLALPGCSRLAYLGEGNGRTLLYDRDRKVLLRISSGDIQIMFPHGDTCHDGGPAKPAVPELSLAEESITTVPGRAFRVRYAAAKPMVVRVSLWHGERIVRQAVDDAHAGRNGIDLRVARPGVYELVLASGPFVRRGSVTVTRSPA